VTTFDTVVEVWTADPQLPADMNVIAVGGIAGIDVGWYLNANSVWTAPAAGVTYFTWPQAQAAAAAELDQTTNISVRCVERQQPVPDAWLTYRDSLRAIRDSTTGDPLTPFPPRPVYPPGIPEVPGYPSGESVWPPPGTGSSTLVLPGGASAADANLAPIGPPATATAGRPGAAPAKPPKHGTRKLRFGMG
jgi:hypothetical protein